MYRLKPNEKTQVLGPAGAASRPTTSSSSATTHGVIDRDRHVRPTRQVPVGPAPVASAHGVIELDREAPPESFLPELAAARTTSRQAVAVPVELAGGTPAPVPTPASATPAAPPPGHSSGATTLLPAPAAPMAPAAAPPTVAGIGKRAKRDSVEASSAALGLGAGDGAGGDSGLLDTGGPSGAGLAWVPGQPPVPGVRIAHYEIIRELGAGGMGAVYLARDLKLGRRVALKILSVQHPELTRRFLIEARATARCHHDNIVIIYEVGQVGDQPYMVLEYLKGHVLTDLISKGRRLPPARALELMLPVLRALIVAHEQGIVHRDLKPDNIFLTDAGGIKVLDFGIAKVHDRSAAREPGAVAQASSGAISLPEINLLGEGTDAGNTMAGVIMGTMKYMAPEQWGIGVDIDHRTDVWAVGLILFRMLAGRHPLYPMTGNQLVVTAMLDQPMPRLREAAPDVPGALADVVDRCLRKVKEERFASARELLRALEPLAPTRTSARVLEGDQSPYAGLASFQENDADRFFGRSREIAAAVARVRERPVVAVTGPSGVGKSSFVRAGLFPALKGGGETWETIVLRPGRNPLAALAAITAPLVGTSNTLTDDLSAQTAEAKKLAAEPGHLGMVLRSRARREKSKIVLFVDQFEELYTLVPDAAERRAFTAALGAAADDPSAPVRVVLSLRSDFLDRVAEDPAFVAEVSAGLFLLANPGRDGLRDALVQPAEMAGYQLESPAMVDDMLAYLETTPGALPLLQFAASRLWERRDVGRKLLTSEAYQAMGGIAGALATHADATLAELPASSQALARTVFMRLITPERTRAVVSMAELFELTTDRGELQRLVDQLVAARLLVSQTGADGKAGGATIEIVHESLVHSWPALRRWLDENQEDAAFIDQLRVAAKQWVSRGRPSGLLWRGDAAEEARRFVRRSRAPLAETERAYLAEVVALASAAERRRRTITIGVVSALTVLLLLAVAGLVKIRGSEQKAGEEAKTARRAESAARLALQQREEEERQRKSAEQATTKAVEKTQVVQGQLDQTYEQLRQKASALELALIEATEANGKAVAAQATAEANATKAKAAQEAAEAAQGEAKRAQAEAERLYNSEKDRRKKLEEQLGSPMVDTLK